MSLQPEVHELRWFQTLRHHLISKTRPQQTTHQYLLATSRCQASQTSDQYDIMSNRPIRRSAGSSSFLNRWTLQFLSYLSFEGRVCDIKLTVQCFPEQSDLMETLHTETSETSSEETVYGFSSAAASIFKSSSYIYFLSCLDLKVDNNMLLF